MSSEFDAYYHTVEIEEIGFFDDAPWVVTLKRHFPKAGNIHTALLTQSYKTREEAEEAMTRLKLEYHID